MFLDDFGKRVILENSSRRNNQFSEITHSFSKQGFILFSIFWETFF